MPVYCSCSSWTTGSSQKDPMKSGLSVLTSCCLSRCFLGTGSLDLPEFWHGARNPYEVLRNRARVFGKKTFLLQNLGKWAKNKVFFNLKKNLLINFHLICSIMKAYIICCVPAQILYWQKSFS